MSVDGVKTEDVNKLSTKTSDEESEEEDNGNISDASDIPESQDSKQKKVIKDNTAFQFGKKLKNNLYYSLYKLKENMILCFLYKKIVYIVIFIRLI